MSELADAKAYWATHHLQGTKIERDEGHEHRWQLAEYIASLKPSSVLEFGCNVGKNLAVLRGYLPGALLQGVDMMEEAIRAGLESYMDAAFRLNLGVGDEDYLAILPAGSHDVVFTCSVLDHIPEPEWRKVYDDMVRVAKRHVVLFEPWDGSEWEMASRGIVSPPFTYCHDYLGHDPKLKVVRRVVTGDSKSPWGEFGKLYHLIARAV